MQQGRAVLCLILDVSQQQVIAHGHPDLDQYCILAGAQKRFDLQILLDPFKEQLNLPS